MSRNNPNVHKNTFGHVLMVAGCKPMMGAAALAGLAAMRAGAGMVTCAVPASLNDVLQKKISPVIMTLPVPDAGRGYFQPAALKTLQAAAGKYTCAAIGPGLGAQAQTRVFIRRFIAACPLPLVVDADGLNALAADPDILKVRKAPTVLTPHPGEMSRLLGRKIPEDAAGLRKVAADFVRKYPCVLVLKNHHTIVASPGQKIYINATGNAGMASAGSGDVLTGMIAALLAQQVPVFQAARTGVYWHGLAGDMAARRIPQASMIATDVIEHIPGALARMLP